ncbi:hypothetical protein MMC17_001895 [Xylographa soralifera]|nr:hypothetical protein [Xylographa soralifera]
MSSHRLFRFPKPAWLNSPNTRTAGVYFAGALFSLGFFFFVDAATFSRSNRNGGEVHIKFVDWIPGMCSALGMLVINSIEKTRLSADSYSYSGTGVAWKARLVLFLGFALMAGGLAGSVAVLVLKYVVPEYPFPTLYFGIANVIANGLIMLSSVVLWVSQNMEDDYTYNLALNKVILPSISPSAIAALHGDLDKADRTITKSDRRRVARQTRSKARLLFEKRKTTDAKVLKADGETKEHGNGLLRNGSPVVTLEEVLLWKGKANGKTKNASGGSENPDTAGSPQPSNNSPATKSPAIRAKGKNKPKKNVQVLTTTGPDGLGVKPGKDEHSTTTNLGEESGTTIFERPPEISGAKPFRRVTTKDLHSPAAVRRVASNTAFRRVASERETVTLPARSRRLTLKQRRQEALERRRKLVNRTIPFTSSSLPQSSSIKSLRETFSVPTKTIREALLAPSSIDKVATKPNQNGLSRYLNANDEWLDETTNKSLAKAVYKKNREKSEAVESETEQKILKSDIKHINAHDYTISALDIQRPAVPSLSYGLDRVLFNPGVYHLQDPRSRVYNFDPYLQSIMPVSEFDFTALKEYITSSQDTSLKEIAQEHGKRYIGSTSSMTGVLAHFHFLLSQWREINTTMMSRGFPDKLTSFTLIQRCPSAIFLRWKDGTYAIDADKEFATSNILSMLGKAMEKLLTLNTDDFERYRKSNPDQLSQEERIEPEAFHYSTMGDFLMRSQLDAHDPRLPGTGMFDLKTRAVVAIRMDTQNPEQGSSYEIKERFGEFESFEREYFDMIRSAFLKYSLQVRMGRMDGIFVAFHNTERIFGFQYISLEEMDLTLHGQSDTALGDQEFKLSLELLNQVLDRATEKFPEQSVRIHFETRDATTPFMYIFAEPVTEDEVNELQSRNQAKIEEFERELLGLHKDEDITEEDNQWDDIQAKVEEAMEKDERGEESSRRIVPSKKAAQWHEAEEYTDASTSTEATEHGTTNANYKSLTTAATRDVEDDGEQDEVEEENSSASNDDHTSSNMADVEEHLEGQEDKSDLLSTIKHVGENETANELGSDVENPEVFAGRDDTMELPINLTDSKETDENTDEIEQGTPNQLVANSAFPDQSTANLDKSSDSIHAPDFDSTADTTFLNSLTVERSSSIPSSHPPVLAMTLTIRNKMDGKYVLRPENIIATKPPNSSDTSSPVLVSGRASAKSNQGWSVEYTITDVQDPDRAWTLYQACQARRKKKLEPEETEQEDKRTEWYVRRMQELNLKGKKWREEMEREESGKKAVVLGMKEEDA